MSDRIDITIIGAGVIGCALAYELSQDGRRDILVVERNPRLLGENQSSRNSGVIHAGIYYAPDREPLKARLCVAGNRLLYEFCQAHQVPSARCGKLVVATVGYEEEYLDEVLSIARENNVPGVEKISGRQAKELEPNVSAACALQVPSSGIVEATQLVRKLAELAQAQKAMFMTGAKVTALKSSSQSCEVTITTRDGDETFETGILINAAGLYADELARMINPGCPHVIEPVRGESAKFYHTRRDNIRLQGMNVYPAPYGFYRDTGEKAAVPLTEFRRLLDQKIIAKTVGVHLTPTFDMVQGQYRIGHTVTIGPMKTVGKSKENYGAGLKPPSRYLEYIQHFFPHLTHDDVELHQAGIMAVLKNGSDFVIERDPLVPQCINLIGIDSPGLTACLAIAQYVSSLITI